MPADSHDEDNNSLNTKLQYEEEVTADNSKNDSKANSSLLNTKLQYETEATADNSKDWRATSLPKKDIAHPTSSESLLLKQKMLNSDFHEGRILSHEQIEIAKNHFKENHDSVKMSRKEANGVPFSVLKTKKGALFAMYRGKEEALGEGKFGKVKLAQNIETGEWVSLKIQKVLTYSETEKEQQIQRIESEYDFQRDVGQFKGSQVRDLNAERFEPFTKAYSVMKLIPAQELHKREDEIDTKLKDLFDVRYKDTPEQWKKDMVDFMSFLTSVSHTTVKDLSGLHEKNIIHRDLHTGNILVTNKGEATIIDFGLALRLDPATKTTHARIGGRRDTISPEAFESKKQNKDHLYSPKDDMWSLGICLGKIQLMSAIAYFGDDVGIPRNEQHEILKMVFNLSNSDPAERPSSDELSKAINHIENYVQLARGIDLRVANAQEVAAYKNSINEYGKENNFATVNVMTQSGRQVNGAEALEILSVPEPNAGLVGIFSEKIEDAQSLRTHFKQLENEFSSFKNIQQDLTRQIDALHKTMREADNRLDFDTFNLLRDTYETKLQPQLKEVNNKLKGIVVQKMLIEAQDEMLQKAPWIVDHRQQEQAPFKRFENELITLQNKQKDFTRQKGSLHNAMQEAANKRDFGAFHQLQNAHEKVLQQLNGVNENITILSKKMGIEAPISKDIPKSSMAEKGVQLKHEDKDDAPKRQKFLTLAFDKSKTSKKEIKQKNTQQDELKTRPSKPKL